MNEISKSEKRKVKNCFSVDVEGFIESNLQSINIDTKYISKTKEKYEIETNVNTILNLLNEKGIKGTFFFLGRIARDMPHIVKETAQCGHEIACHSLDHLRIYGMTKDTFTENVRYAKGILEDVSGKKVHGFRAPDFSITTENLWALDVLREIGFEYDSSICPAGLHDVYGIGDADPRIHKLSNELIEFPVSVVDLWGKRIPFGGGGYFRLYPLFMTRLLIQKINKSGHPCMLYIHPYEVGPEIPLISDLSPYRKFRHYYGCKKGKQRITKLLKSLSFATAIEILKEKKHVS